MMNEAKMTELTQAEDTAYFRADLCIYSPESHSPEEKKEICNGLMAASKAVLDAMRGDFEQQSPDARASTASRTRPRRIGAAIGRGPMRRARVSTGRVSSTSSQRGTKPRRAARHIDGRLSASYSSS